MVCDKGYKQLNTIKPPIVANVLSLKGLKIHELRANTAFINEAFTETSFDNSCDRGTFIRGFGSPIQRKLNETFSLMVILCLTNFGLNFIMNLDFIIEVYSIT